MNSSSHHESPKPDKPSDDAVFKVVLGWALTWAVLGGAVFHNWTAGWVGGAVCCTTAYLWVTQRKLWGASLVVTTVLAVIAVLHVTAEHRIPAGFINRDRIGNYNCGSLWHSVGSDRDRVWQADDLDLPSEPRGENYFVKACSRHFAGYRRPAGLAIAATAIAATAAAAEHRRRATSAKPGRRSGQTT